MKDGSDVYLRLREHLDVMPVAFPATASGVELRILSRLFTPEEAEVALFLSAVPETLDRVFRRARRSGRRSRRSSTGSRRRAPSWAGGSSSRPTARSATARRCWPSACTSSRSTG